MSYPVFNLSMTASFVWAPFLANVSRVVLADDAPCPQGTACAMVSTAPPAVLSREACCSGHAGAYKIVPTHTVDFAVLLDVSDGRLLHAAVHIACSHRSLLLRGTVRIVVPGCFFWVVRC